MSIASCVLGIIIQQVCLFISLTVRKQCAWNNITSSRPVDVCLIWVLSERGLELLHTNDTRTLALLGDAAMSQEVCCSQPKKASVKLVWAVLENAASSSTGGQAIVPARTGLLEAIDRCVWSFHPHHKQNIFSHLPAAASFHADSFSSICLCCETSVSLRFVPAPQYNSGDWNSVLLTAAALFQKNAVVTPHNSFIYDFQCLLKPFTGAETISWRLTDSMCDN